MAIRAATQEDAAAVAALWTEGYTGRGEGEGRRLPYAESDYAQSARQGRVLVAERDGAVVGVVVFFAPGDATWTVAPGEAGLSRLVVGEAARGGGLGRALVEVCVERARRAGAESISLWSRPYQRPAHRLYEAAGFRRAPQADSGDRDGARWFFTLDLDRPR
ncbi:MAG: GNAT family N-acetyltransferase [Solirubrobacterales bacterium]